MTLDRGQMLPSDAGQLDKSGRQALTIPGTRSPLERLGVHHSGTLHPRSHTCWMPGTETHVGELASEALKPSLNYEVTAESHRANEPSEKCRAAKNRNDWFLGQVGIRGKMLRFLPQ